MDHPLSQLIWGGGNRAKVERTGWGEGVARVGQAISGQVKTKRRGNERGAGKKWRSWASCWKKSELIIKGYEATFGVLGASRSP